MTLIKKIDTVVSALQKLTNKAQRGKLASVEMSTKLQELHAAVTNKRPLQENEQIITHSELVEKHRLTLPLQNISDFEKFKEKLVNDES